MYYYIRVSVDCDCFNDASVSTSSVTFILKASSSICCGVFGCVGHRYIHQQRKSVRLRMQFVEYYGISTIITIFSFHINNTANTDWAVPLYIHSTLCMFQYCSTFLLPSGYRSYFIHSLRHCFAHVCCMLSSFRCDHVGWSTISCMLAKTKNKKNRHCIFVSRLILELIIHIFFLVHVISILSLILFNEQQQ